MAKHPASKNIPKDTNAGDLLLQGSILAIAGILVRFIGLLYKVPMIRILGQEGIGYYNTAYEIYNIGLILSSYSLPLAMSKLIAARRVRRQYQDIRRVFFSGLTVSAAAGGLMTLLLLLGGDFITTVIFKSPSSALPLKVMAPTIFVFSIMGVIRGYFQGQGNMVPTSVSQIIEQVVHAAVSIAASYAFMVWFASRPNPKSYGAAGGTLGTLCGAVAALIYLAIRMLCFQRRNARTLRRPQKIHVETWGNVYSALFLTLTPIILSQFVYQLSGSVDNSMFGQIMDAKGLTETQRATLLGVYGGEYRLLSNVPVAIASSLGASMIPSIVQSRTCHRLKEVRYKIRMTIKFNMLIAIPCAVGMGVLAGPIMELIFHDNSELSANLMRIGAPAVVFFSGNRPHEQIRQPFRHFPGSAHDPGICHVSLSGLECVRTGNRQCYLCPGRLYSQLVFHQKGAPVPPGDPDHIFASLTGFLLYGRRCTRHLLRNVFSDSEKFHLHACHGSFCHDGLRRAHSPFKGGHRGGASPDALWTQDFDSLKKASFIISIQQSRPPHRADRLLHFQITSSKYSLTQAFSKTAFRTVPGTA